MFIYILTTDNQHFIVDEGLSPSVATRLCKRYNDTWCTPPSKVSCNKPSETHLKCIKGYCVSDKDDLTLAHVKKLVNNQIN